MDTSFEQASVKLDDMIHATDHILSTMDRIIRIATEINTTLEHNSLGL